MNCLKLASFLIMIIFLTKTTHSLRCYDCTDCKSNMTLNSISNCSANSSCAGIIFSKNGYKTNIALCLPSDYSNATNEQVGKLLAKSFGTIDNTIKVQNKRCCNTDLCVEYTDLNTYYYENNIFTTTFWMWVYLISILFPSECFDLSNDTKHQQQQQLDERNMYNQDIQRIEDVLANLIR
ncbi:unnamed protein product [Brachionus calyciflorus]|uniref:Uncharacterized protein n=1 Tax=Brachionus calyciflorus TaxID=104777 RepID=A0A813NBV6_9BILA|nr:unnamed protein product [Brachionus calyciflorus]